MPIFNLYYEISDESTIKYLVERYIFVLKETFMFFVDAPDGGVRFGGLYTSVVLLARYAVLGLAVSALFRRLSVR